MTSIQHTEIRRGRIFNLIFALLGYQYSGISVSVKGITLLARSPRCLALTEIDRPLHVTSTLCKSSVVITTRNSEEIKVVGLNRKDADYFVSSANAVWGTTRSREGIRVAGPNQKDADHFVSFANTVLGQRIIAQIESVDVKLLWDRKRYPSAHLIEPFLQHTKTVAETLPDNIPVELFSCEKQNVLNTIQEFWKDPDQWRDAAIRSFTDAELRAFEGFFDTIEAQPLTPQQRLAVVTDEDATLTLAGAGSGKTSVIVAKAAYLIKSGLRRPDEILLIAFGKDAAVEMSRRIKDRTGVSVTAMTFHALGYSIIREVEQGTPALAAHASDDVQFRAVLRDILINDLASDPKLGRLLIKWFSEFYRPYKSEWDFKTKDEYFQYISDHELRTLQGEVVKSFEELEIANWLYENSIDYEYEPDYEHALPKRHRKAYTPDFRLTESGIYIEHFGVRKAHGPYGKEELVTAPFVDCAKYLKDMEWKRKVHKEHGTVLIETFSYDRVENRLTKALEEKLAPFVAPEPRPLDHLFGKLLELGQIDPFTQTLATFLRHYKSAGTMLEHCLERAQLAKDKARCLAFLQIFKPLYDAYQRRLGDRIDFEDMIVCATDLVASKKYSSRWRHFLVDEFQDMSEGRANLLRALKAQHSDARIFAVGDDWQSIYRFAGSDIHLMRGFGSKFGGMFNGKTGIYATVDLGRTFRSVDRIALPARAFVLKNPSQIEKQIVPAGQADAPAIQIMYYTGAQDIASLRVVLDGIQANSSKGPSSVLLLGRYRFVSPADLCQIAAGYPDLHIKFMTVHASKGLEADHVIILRMVSGRMGFPSEVVDDPILDIVLPEPETFDHAEERRLFYVALTRARKTVTILADRQKPSAFVRELTGNPEYTVVELGEAGIAEHRCGACGGRMLAYRARKTGRRFFACEHRKLCGEALNPCCACVHDLPVSVPDKPGTFICSCGAKFPGCPKCPDGWLVVRKGQYGKFMSCVKFPNCTGKANFPKAHSQPRVRQFRARQFRVRQSRSRRPKASRVRIES